MLSIPSLPLFAGLCVAHHKSEAPKMTESCHSQKMSGHQMEKNHASIEMNHKDNCPICALRICDLKTDLNYTLSDANLRFENQSIQFLADNSNAVDLNLASVSVIRPPPDHNLNSLYQINNWQAHYSVFIQ